MVRGIRHVAGLVSCRNNISSVMYAYISSHIHLHAINRHVRPDRAAKSCGEASGPRAIGDGAGLGAEIAARIPARHQVIPVRR